MPKNTGVVPEMSAGSCQAKSIQAARGLKPDCQAMMPARHILVVNSRSAHQPVFVVGAPHSGADLIGRALKASAGFHVTIGQPSVLRTVYAFARRPSMHHGPTPPPP